MKNYDNIWAAGILLIVALVLIFLIMDGRVVMQDVLESMSKDETTIDKETVKEE